MFTFCLQSFVLDALLACRTVLPACLRTFVATNMEVFAREERYYFVEDIAQEIEHIFFTSAHHKILDAPNSTWAPFLALARKVWVSSYCCHHMTRKIDFWNYCDIALCCVVNYFLYLFLSIIATIRRAVTLGADATYGSQLRIFLDFYTPSLIFGEVEVHGVDLKHRHKIQLLLHILYSNEMAAWVEVEATITKARSIFDVAALSHPFHSINLSCTFYLSRQQLHKTLHAIEGALGCFSLDSHAFSCYAETITLLRHLQRWCDLNSDISFFVAQSNLVACRSF